MRRLHTAAKSGPHSPQLEKWDGVFSLWWLLSLQSTGSRRFTHSNTFYHRPLRAGPSSSKRKSDIFTSLYKVREWLFFFLSVTCLQQRVLNMWSSMIFQWTQMCHNRPDQDRTSLTPQKSPYHTPQLSHYPLSPTASPRANFFDF